jgi:hypothetical protein
VPVPYSNLIRTCPLLEVLSRRKDAESACPLFYSKGAHGRVPKVPVPYSGAQSACPLFECPKCLSLIRTQSTCPLLEVLSRRKDAESACPLFYSKRAHGRVPKGCPKYLSLIRSVPYSKLFETRPPGRLAIIRCPVVSPVQPRLPDMLFSVTSLEKRILSCLALLILLGLIGRAVL